MQGTNHRSLRTGLFGAGWTLVAAAASARPLQPRGRESVPPRGEDRPHFRQGSTRLLGLALSVLLASAGTARGGNIYLTGHDILLHDGQSGYDEVVLDFLRGAGSPNEIPRANYDIGVLGSGVGIWGWTNVPGFGDAGTGPNVPPGFESTTFYNTDDLDGNPALQAAALSHDVLVILSHRSCGGCDLSTAGSNIINTQMAAGIAASFDAGMDLWLNSGADLATYYDFLPPEFATTAPPIEGLEFCANTAGEATGITPLMTTGFETHNRFEGFSDLLTIFETNCPDDPEQVISLAATTISLSSELSPFLDLNAPGTEHTVTLHIAGGAAGIAVTFTVLSGPNAGHGAVVNTDEGGNAGFTYVGDGRIGVDGIRASFENPTTGKTLNSNVVLKFWDNDCNENGVPDTCDLDCDGFDGDCNEFQPDCGRSADDNSDGVPNECAQGTIIFVDGTCGDDAFSGSDSTCAAPNGPKETIQAAIMAAQHGDEIVIAPGTYPETIDFLGKAITVRSSGGAAVTTIDGRGSGPVVTCANGEGPNSVLFDLTITGGSAFRGAGMFNLDSSPTVINCIFRGNTALPGTGGGMYNQGRNPSVSNCTFQSNTASTGGGMANDMSDPAVTNCVFAGNSANFGGAVHNLASNPVVTNCTFNRNSAGNGAGAIYGGAVSGVLVTNSILWNSSPDAIGSDGTGTISVVFCNVQGGFPGAGNINALPLFADATGPDDIPGTADDDLRLLFPSPCIDVALNAAFTSCLPDRAGNERFVDEPLIPDCAVCGAPPVIDMGAYEFGGKPTLDCNTNGLIDICEIGTERAPDCNGNGIPDECDLASGFSADCNGNFIPDACDINSGLSIDCDGNLVPDECEVLFLIAESTQLSPVGAGALQSFTIPNAPDSGGIVTLSFEAIGDLGATVEFVDVDINGTAVGTVYVHARDCPVQSSTDEILISRAVYNAAITSDAVINMVASPQVDPNQCSSLIAVTVSYQAVTAADQNGDGSPDPCDCPGDLDFDGEVGPPDLLLLLSLWRSNAGLPIDLDGDGTVGVPDMLQLLAAWGPCP